MIKVGIVVPTYKKELWDKFYDKWDGFDSDNYEVILYVVEDNPKKTITFSSPDVPIKHYDWKDIDKDLGEDAWIISRRSSAIRSYGYLKAYQDGMDYVLTLDDDCYPSCHQDIEALIKDHLAALNGGAEYSNTYHVGKQLFGRNVWMRGSPIRYRRPRSAVVSVGGWENNADLDAWTQLETQNMKFSTPEVGIVNVPKYLGLTMCGMNVMFKRETISIAYFLLQGEKWGVDRVDDIWAGLFMKKVLDHFDLPMCINGYASVYHDRASDAMTSLKKEGLTLQETELLWDRLSSINLSGQTLTEVYIDMTNKCEDEWFGTSEYGSKLRMAMLTWVDLFD